MRKIFFVVLMAALAFPMMQAQQSNAKAARAQKAQSGLRHDNRAVTPQAPMQFKAALNDPIPEGMALVSLTVGDVWSDGSGYQMLLDADATAYGTIFSQTGSLTPYGFDADEGIYGAFEYKIPENADGARNTTNVVINNSISILIPAGVYDYVITNPVPDDRIFIASPNGNVGGRYDNFDFEAGKAYAFTVTHGDNGYDATDVVITGGESSAPTMPTSVTVDPASTIANVTWADYDDYMWNLRYRVYNPDADPDAVSYFWDFEDGMGEWTSIDADGDGNMWYLNDPLAAGYDPGDGVCLFGTRCLTSASYDNATGPLTPDNWLISPQVLLDGQLSFWAGGQSASWPAEKFAVYVTTGDPNDINGYVKISDDIIATSPITEYTFDLSEYAGQQGYVAVRHYDITDMFRLNIDNVSIGSQSAPAPWIMVNDLTSREYTLENLALTTTYEVQVQAVNVNGTSDWTESTIFTTLSDQAITEVYVYGYESPVDGENSQDHLNITVPEGANYHLYVNSWSPEWWDNDVDDEFFGTFVGGTRYSIGLTLEANDGYYFADNCVYYMNGGRELIDNSYTGVDEETNTFAYVWTVPEMATGGDAPSYIITEVYVNGYESPVAGEDSQAHLNITVPEDANYHVFVNKWSPEWWDNDADDDFFGTFVEGTYYSVGMTLEANEGYRFADNCVFYVNGSRDIVDADFSYVDDEDDNIYAYVWTIPEAASASAPQVNIITEVYVNGYESPVAGEDSQAHLNITVPEGANYHIFANKWSPEWWDNDADDDFFGTFVEGTYYSVGMTLEANEGYQFAEDCVFYVNGSQTIADADFCYVEDGGEYAYVWTVPEAAVAGETPIILITEVYVDGYESPVAGEDSQAHLNITVPEDANYHIFANKWSPEWWDNDADDDFFGIFVEGTYYSVGMTLEANEGYQFAEDCVFYVNGSDVRVDTDYSYVEDGGEYAYLWTIPEAAGAGSTSVNEQLSGKTVASVRYFNVAGQEIPQADGMTIVVTTYTDGTTSTTKVVK